RIAAQVEHDAIGLLAPEALDRGPDIGRSLGTEFRESDVAGMRVEHAGILDRAPASREVALQVDRYRVRLEARAALEQHPDLRALPAGERQGERLGAHSGDGPVVDAHEP